jgi:hypothetical protein
MAATCSWEPLTSTAWTVESAHILSAGSPVTTSLITGLGRLTTIVESGGKLYFANNGPISVFTTGGSEITTNWCPA